MLISVIIPVYNGEKYIKKAIDSALNQTFKGDYQVIVVDDCSTDSTLDILLNEYNDKILIDHHQVNKGTASALNTGIKQTTGKWIKWLSADDEMLPNCLETLVNNATDHNTIYYTDYHIIDAKGKHKMNYIEQPRPVSDLWNAFYGNGSTSFIHRDVFDKCGLFDESLRHSEDYEFWLRTTMVYGVKMDLIPVITINYRNHPDQLTHKIGGSNDAIIKERIKSQLTVR